MSQVEYIRFQGEESGRKSVAPVTLEWNHALMVRAHSIRAAVSEIINANRSLDFVRVNIIGSSSTGKSTLSHTIGHLIHKMAKIPYTVRKFNREELLNFEQTLSTLTATNHIMIFDDVSWLSANAGKKHIDRIQKEFTEVRHLPGGQDIKIILILNFHYSYAIPKPLRQAEFFVYTSIGSSEIENLEKTVGKKYAGKINDFRRIFQETLTTGKEATEDRAEIPKTFSYHLGNKGKKFTYQYKAPFVPALWWNNSTLRHVVFPARTWIDPVCGVCSGDVPINDKDHMDIEQFKKDLDHRCGPLGKTAVRIKLYQMGINTFHPNIKNGLTFFEKYMQNRTVNTDALIKAFDLKIIKTRLHKSPTFEKQNVTQ